MKMLRHNQARGRALTPGTSAPSPTPLPTAMIGPEPSAHPGRGLRRWVLAFESGAPSETDPLTGWRLSADPLAQVRITFPDMQSAIIFAERNGWRYELAEPQATVRRIRFDPTWAGEALNECPV